MAMAISLFSGCGTGGPPLALPGVWRGQFNDPTFGSAAVELILMTDGSFLQQTAYQGGALVTIYGTYQVMPEIGRLRLNVQRGEPAQACGPLGCTNIIYPSESHSYSLTSATTLTLQNVNCTPSPVTVCVINYTKVV
jgi:hypothetical protein